MQPRRTLLCVHAHPDDEALFTAGVTQHYAQLGYRVVLVTCTNGQYGLDEHARAGSDPDHDTELTRIIRAGELQRAAPLAGFDRVIALGYDDSGMMGWPQNDVESAFWQVDVEAASRTLASIIDELDASVVLTYDENGFYGHPDHIMANRVTRAAVEKSSSAQRLYYPIVPQSILTTFVPDAQALEVFLPAWVLDAGIGSPDELVTTTMDVRAFAEGKREAIATHASQIDNGDFITLDEELFLVLFGTEYYHRAWSRHDALGDETDLFGGLE